MNHTETEHKPEAPPNETFIIAKTDEGYRVCSPLMPGKQYLVSGLPDNAQCTCPDFAQNEGDPGWHCKHILAVLKEVESVSRPIVNGAPTSTGNSGSGEPPRRTEKGAPGGRNDNGAVMLLKRSVSPDGRIDSLSVEFSCPIGKATPHELKERAGRILALQGDIAAGFLNGNGNANRRNGEANAAAGQLLAVASMNGRYGKRLFLNILVNGKILKLFGNEKELAEAVRAAGYESVAEHLEDGYSLNLPCRVVTKPSPDGKYINVERVLPAQSPAPAK